MEKLKFVDADKKPPGAQRAEVDVKRNPDTQLRMNALTAGVVANTTRLKLRYRSGNDATLLSELNPHRVPKRRNAAPPIPLAARRPRQIKASCIAISFHRSA